MNLQGGLGITSRSALADIAFFSAAAAMPFTKQTLLNLFTPTRGGNGGGAAAAAAAAAGVAASSRVSASECEAAAQQQFESSGHYRRIEAAHATFVHLAGDELPSAMRNSSSSSSSVSSISGFWGAFTNGVQPKLQHRITARYHSAVVRFWAKDNPALRARLASCRTASASLWLSAPISECAGRYLADPHAIAAIRHRIGVPSVTGLPRKCRCGVSLETPLEQYGHVHWCSKLKAAAAAQRHNAIVSALNGIARDAGVHTVVEVVQPTFNAIMNREQRTRPDLLLHGADAIQLVDVLCCHPCAPSHLQLAPSDVDDRRLRVIMHGETAKRSKYQQTALDVAQETNMPVHNTPFVCDAYGAIGASGEQVLRWIAGEASWGDADVEPFSTSRPSRARAAFIRMSIAIQRAVAQGALAAARYIRRAADRAVDGRAF